MAMQEMSQEEKNLSSQMGCYGLLYEEYITPCRDRCKLRIFCREKLQESLREDKETVFREQRRMTMETEDAIKEPQELEVTPPQETAEKKKDLG